MPSQTKVITDVQTEAWTTAFLKTYLRNTFTAGENAELGREEDIIEYMQKSARQSCESFARFTALTKVLDFWTDEIAEDYEISLPRGPHQSVDNVYTQDSEGEETEVVLNTGYYKRGLTDYIITLNTAVTVPVIVTSATQRGVNPVRIRFTAGYTDETIPESVREAILQTILLNWKYRSEIFKGIMKVTLPGTAKELLASERRFTL